MKNIKYIRKDTKKKIPALSERLRVSFKKRDAYNVKEEAKKAGFKTTSSFIREITLSYLRNEYIKIINQPPINKTTASLLRYSSNNLNQLVHLLHILKLSGTAKDEKYLIEKIKGLIESIELLTEKLNEETAEFE